MAPSIERDALIAAKKDWCATEAEAEGHDGGGSCSLEERLAGSRDVLLDLLATRVREVRHEVEVLVARLDTGRPSEVGDRDGVAGRRCAPRSELDINRYGPRTSGRITTAGPTARGDTREGRREAAAVFRLQFEPLGRRSAGHRRHDEIGGDLRRTGIKVKAHVTSSHGDLVTAVSGPSTAGCASR
jgi:hypothetical protein